MDRESAGYLGQQINNAGEEVKSGLKSAGYDIGWGLLIGAISFALIRGCNDDQTVTHVYENPPAIEQLRQENEELREQYLSLERRLNALQPERER